MFAGPAGVSGPRDHGTIHPAIGQLHGAAVDDEDAVAFAAGDDSIIAIDAFTGELLWQRDNPAVDRDNPADSRVVGLTWLPPTVAAMQSVPGGEADEDLPPQPLLVMQTRRLSDPTEVWWLFDVQTGRTLRTLTIDTRPPGGVIDRDHSAAVFDHDTGHWLSVTNDGFQWRRLDPAAGRVVDRGQLDTALMIDHAISRFHRSELYFDSERGGLNWSLYLSGPRLFHAFDGAKYQVAGTRIIRTSSTRTDPVRPAAIADRIESTASLGTPRDPELPSANPGQIVRVIGQNLHDRVTLVNQTTKVVSSSSGRTLNPQTRTARRVAVDPAGRWADFELPASWGAGSVQLIDNANDGAVTELPLQIIPTLRFPNPGQLVDETLGLTTGVLLNRSYWNASDVPGRYVLFVDDLPVGGCATGNLDNCDFSEMRFGNVRVTGSATLVTPDGTHRLVVERPQPQVLPILDRDYAAMPNPRVPAHQIDLSGGDSAAVLAGSTLIWRTDPLQNDLPDTIFATLRSDRELPGRESARAVIIDRDSQTGDYRLTLPMEFRGGWLSLDSQRSGNPAEPTREMRIDIAPTIVAATGESTRPGSPLILAGINLEGVAYRIGDHPATVQVVSAGSYRFDSLLLTVPEDPGDGRVSLSVGDTHWTIDAIEPWWDIDAVPTAGVGTVTLPSLPSYNPLEVSYDGRDRFNLSPPGLQMRFYGDEPTSRLMPIVPKLTEVGVATFEEPSQSSRKSFESAKDYLTLSVGESATTEFQWGQFNTEIDFSIRRLRPIDVGATPGGVPSISQQIFLGSSTDVIYLRWQSSSINRLRLLHHQSHEVAIDLTSLGHLPDGPIEVGSFWGRSEYLGSAIDDGHQTFLNALTADSGTPADPMLPSVNLGQEFDLPIDFERPSDSLHFTRVPTDLNSAEWTSSLGGLQSSGRWTVPLDAVSGPVRYGFTGPEQFVQVVPTVFAHFVDDRLLVQFSGVGNAGRLHLGDQVIDLTAEELARGAVLIDPAEPRFASLEPIDWTEGLSVSSAGGRSGRLVIAPITGGEILAGDQSTPIEFPRSSPIVLRRGERLRLETVAPIDSRLAMLDRSSMPTASNRLGHSNLPELKFEPFPAARPGHYLLDFSGSVRPLCGLNACRVVFLESTVLPSD